MVWFSLVLIQLYLWKALYGVAASSGFSEVKLVGEFWAKESKFRLLDKRIEGEKVKEEHS